MSSAKAIPDLFNAVVCAREEVAPGCVFLDVQPDTSPAPDFEPGQYALLGLPDAQAGEGVRRHTSGKQKLVRRAYSIASAPNDHSLSFLIVEVPDGRLSPRLVAPEVGTRVWLSPRVQGHFTLPKELNDTQDLVMVATGTGLAPFLSMLRHAVATGKRPWRHCALLHGVRHRPFLAAERELTELAATGLFTYLPTLTRPEEDWTGLQGRTGAHLLGEALNQARISLDPDNTHIMLCGNPAMVDDSEAALTERGYKRHKKTEPGRLHLERYW